MTIVAPGIGRYESVDVIDPGVYDHSGIELDGGLQNGVAPDPREKPMPLLERACAGHGRHD